MQRRRLDGHRSSRSITHRGEKDMAVIKCKMCGGNLNITEGLSVVECEYCGNWQAIPAVDRGIHHEAEKN